MALEVRSGRFGFALLQDSTLLDWGVRRYPADSVGTAVALRRVRTLLDRYSPSLVITRQTCPLSLKSSQSSGAVIQAIRTELKNHSIKFEVSTRKRIKRFFATHGCNAKHEIASLLAERFAPLKWALPRRRRPWDSEAYATAIFDAVAIAVAFTGTRSVKTRVSQ